MACMRAVAVDDPCRICYDVYVGPQGLLLPNSYSDIKTAIGKSDFPIATRKRQELFGRKKGTRSYQGVLMIIGKLNGRACGGWVGVRVRCSVACGCSLACSCAVL
eukprot:2740307-Pleurochrysis_carterae.AAC.1